jgi:probable addiction module antidote protein
MACNDPQVLMKALAEVAKALGVNKVAEAAGVNRESLYKTLKGGSKTRYETVQKLMLALGVELTVRPITATTAKKTAVIGKT